MMMKLVHSTSDLSNFNSLDGTRMYGMQHVGSKKNKDQLNQYFNASDLAHYKPKKDQCDICNGY